MVTGLFPGGCNMSIILFTAGALALAFAVWRLAKKRHPLQMLILLYLIIAIGSGLVTAAALMSIAP